MWTTFTNKVRNAFTEAADQYDILTSLHKEIGREMVKKVVKLNAPTILDVGCGTGYAANKAKFFFPESQIIGLDLAEGMVRKAQEMHEGIPIHWVQADACDLPFQSNSVDLIVSNLAYQWAGNFKKACAEAFRVLPNDGVMNATIFGAQTCYELFFCLQQLRPDIALRRLPLADDVRQALSMAGFRHRQVDYEVIKVEFKDVVELLHWLKAIGANVLGREKAFIGKQMLKKMDELYRQRYPYNNGICASFEVIWIYAQK